MRTDGIAAHGGPSHGQGVPVPTTARHGPYRIATDLGLALTTVTRWSKRDTADPKADTTMTTRSIDSGCIVNQNKTETPAGASTPTGVMAPNRSQLGGNLMKSIQPTSAEGDQLARDLLGTLLWISAHKLTYPPKKIDLEVCTICGALERADRACQVCLATRRAAA